MCVCVCVCISDSILIQYIRSWEQFQEEQFKYS